MAMITVCDLCRKNEIKDGHEVDRFSFPTLVFNETNYFTAEKKWWGNYDMDICEDCRMKVIDALKDIVKLERHIGRENDDEL